MKRGNGLGMEVYRRGGCERGKEKEGKGEGKEIVSPRLAHQV